jgi:hypothetical protein
MDKPIEQLRDLIKSLESDAATFKGQFGLLVKEPAVTQALAYLGLIDIIRAQLASRRKEFKTIAEELSKVKL